MLTALQLRHLDPQSKLGFDRMPEPFTIRLATIDDVDVIAEHRARMFDEMGDVRPGTFEILRAKSRDRLREFLNRGEYIGWLAIPAERPDLIVGGAGVQLRQTLPHPIYQAGKSGTESRKAATPSSSMSSPSHNGAGKALPWFLCNESSSGRGPKSSIHLSCTLRMPDVRSTNGSALSARMRCV